MTTPGPKRRSLRRRVFNRKFITVDVLTFCAQQIPTANVRESKVSLRYPRPYTLWSLDMIDVIVDYTLVNDGASDTHRP